VFIACGDDDEIQTSPTGATWTRRSDTGEDFNACAAGQTGAVCVGDNGNIRSSVDGITSWNVRTSAHGAVNINDVCYSPTLDRFLAVGSTATVQRSTASGSTWSAASNVTVMGGANLFDCCWSEEHQLFFAASQAAVYKSADGLVWSAATGSVTFADPGDVRIVVALPEHLAVFRADAGFVNLYRISELDGTPGTVIGQSLVDNSTGGDDISCVVRMGSGSAHAGRLLACGDAMARLSGYVG
jgi:hypothetical protein